jgi:AcrR family transcriptional regulator
VVPESRSRPPSRRTQAQRRASTRGALTHHFTSKAALVLAAVDFPYEDFSENVRKAATELPADPAGRVRLGVQLIWDRFHGPLFVAAMELWTAARTDAELRAALLPHERRLRAQLRELAFEVLGEQVARHPAADGLYQVLLTSMRGQAMTYALRPDAARSPFLQHWLTVVDAFTREEA